MLANGRRGFAPRPRYRAAFLGCDLSTVVEWTETDEMTVCVAIERAGFGACSLNEKQFVVLFGIRLCVI